MIDTAGLDWNTLGYGAAIGIVLFVIVFFYLIVPGWRGGGGVWPVLDWPMKWLGVSKRQEGLCGGPEHPNSAEERAALAHMGSIPGSHAAVRH